MSSCLSPSASFKEQGISANFQLLPLFLYVPRSPNFLSKQFPLISPANHSSISILGFGLLEEVDIQLRFSYIQVTPMRFLAKGQCLEFKLRVPLKAI